MQNATLRNGIHRKFMRLQPALNERSRRLWAATEALELGWEGATVVAQATGLAPAPIRAGIREAHSLAASPPTPEERPVVWQPRGGAVLKTLPPKPAARSRLLIGNFGPSDSALAAARGGRLRRPAADRHAARCASREIA